MTKYELKNMYKTASLPCKTSPVVLLKRLEQDCNKTYKTTNGLRYYLVTPGSQQTTSSLPSPISPNRILIRQSSSVTIATVNNDNNNISGPLVTSTPIITTQITPPQSPLLTQQTQARESVMQGNNQLLSESQSSLSQQSDDSINTSLEAVYGGSPISVETLFNVLLSDSPTNSINNDNNSNINAANSTSQQQSLIGTNYGNENVTATTNIGPNDIITNSNIPEDIISNAVEQVTGSGSSPPPNISSNILYITNLVLPFVATLLQIKKLLSKTGTIVENGFWMDRIKSECYVKYETEDQAIKTKHELHGVSWPTINSQCPNVNFGTEEAMETAIKLLKKEQFETVENKIFECDQCGSKFTQKSNLKTHKNVHTGERPFECDECGSKFKWKSSLKTHKNLHTGERPFECDECGSKFKWKSSLKTHKNLHTGERPFECDECGSKFALKSYLISHKNVHTGERPFECDECGSKFKWKSSLKTHKNLHTGERPFECDECGSKFKWKSSLKTHKNLHTGERPFECDECGSKFKWKSSLKTHKNVHTGEKLFECDQCNKKFALRSTLKQHTQTHNAKKTIQMR